MSTVFENEILPYIDHDECKGNVHGCEQQCLNVPGGYNCACSAGYRLNAQDSKTCDGILCMIVQTFRFRKFTILNHSIKV